MLQYNPSISGSLSVTGSLIVTNGVIGTVSGVDVQIFSSSINQVITGIQSTTSSQDGRLSSIESFTSSTSARLNSIETISASNISRIGSLEIISASNIARIGSIESFTASVSTTNTFTSSANNRLNNLETISASNITRLINLENKTGSLATTGSNTFIGNQTISGTVYIQNNLVVQGSSSLQNITASAVSIGTNTVLLNTATPSIRYGGISVVDSGSAAGKSGSLYFDSTDNEWIFVHQGNTSVTSSTVITGPETYDNLGNETHLTDNRIPKMTNGFHIVDSNTSDDGTTIKHLINTEITGSLKVTANATMGNAFTIQGGTGLTKHYFTSAGSGDALNQLYDNNGTVKVQLYTNGNSYFNGGNVGIGTTNPTYPLTIYASSTQTSMGLMSGYSNSGARNWGIGANSLVYGDLNIAQSTAQGGEPFSAGTSRIYIASSGYIGMGNTNPQAKLHIGASFNTLPVSTSVALAGDSCIRFTGGLDGNSDYGSFIYGAQDNGYRLLQLGTRHAGTDSVALNVRGSNVGIGTIDNSPYAGTSALAVVGNTSGNFGISIDNRYAAAASGTTSVFLYNSGSLKVRYDYARDLDAGIIGTVATIPLQIFTGNTVKMVVANSGNVAIGTTSPYSGAKLQVKTATNVNLSIQTGTADATGVKLNAFNDAADTNIPLELNGSILYLKTGESTKMTVANGGSVGIGTTNPGYKLDVYTAGATSAIRVNADSGQNSQLRLEEAGTVKFAATYVPGDSALRMYFGGSDFLNLKGGGVGIGTTNPTTTLDVRGNIYASGANFTQGGVNRVVFAGSVSGNASISFIINNQSQSVFKITAMMTHYGYINSYGCARMSLVANGPTFQEVNISDTSSGNGGSWSFTQIDSTRFYVTKNAGTYGGGGNYFIEIVGNSVWY